MIPLRDINPTRVFPVVTLALIIANVVVFFFVQPREEPESEGFFYEYAAISCELTTGDPLDVTEITDEVCRDESLGEAPFPDKGVYLAVLISLFLHGGIGHLLFNMWSLWIFGNNVEEAYGRVGYLALYVAAGLVATAGFVLFNQDSTIPLVGASGAIAGVMGSYLVLFPSHRVLTFVFIYVVTLPAVVFLGVWLAVQFLLAGQNTNVAWEAHVFGFLFGVVISLLFRPVLRRRTSEFQLEDTSDPFRTLSA